MKFFYLPVAGILCLLGYGHAVLRLLNFPPCTTDSEYLYIISESIAGYGDEWYRIVGSSGPHVLVKTVRDVTIDFTSSSIPGEQARFPVKGCEYALDSALKALIECGFVQQVFYGYYHAFFFVPPHQSYLFCFSFENAIGELVEIKVPPEEWLEPCTNHQGYVHTVAMNFTRKDRPPIHCIRVVGSSNALRGDPLKAFEVIKLPLKEIQLGSSKVRSFQVSNCLAALTQLRQEITTRFKRSWNIGTLHGVECYRHVEDKELKPEKDLDEEARRFVTFLYTKLG